MIIWRLSMNKFTRILFCFVPFLLAYAIQLSVSIPVMGIVFADTVIKAEPGTSFWSMYADFANILTHQNVSGTISLLYSVSVIIVFGFWYQKRFEKLELRSIPSCFNVPRLFGLVLMVPGLQFLSTYVISFTAAIHPQWLDNYQKLMETAGLTDVLPIMAVYAIFTGPVCEELIFRGVIMSYAKERFSFWAANLIQALLFGLFHMNVIQGVYAFFVGMFLGYVRHQTKSMFPNMLLHILFNSWGVLITDTNIMYKADTPLFFVIWFFVGLILTIFGMLLVKKAKVSSDISDN